VVLRPLALRMITKRARQQGSAGLARLRTPLLPNGSPFPSPIEGCCWQVVCRTCTSDDSCLALSGAFSSSGVLRGGEGWVGFVARDACYYSVNRNGRDASDRPAGVRCGMAFTPSTEETFDTKSMYVGSRSG